MKERIIKKLSKSLKIKELEVVNKSHLHAGHAGNSGGDETHFDIIISAQELENQPLITAHRKIKELLKEEFESGLHALSIKIKK